MQLTAFWAKWNFTRGDCVIVNLFRRGDLFDRGDWRGITLFVIIGGVIAGILDKKLFDAIFPGIGKG